MSQTKPQAKPIVRHKPIRQMVGATADAITASMVAVKDVTQALGFEAKTMKLESYIGYKSFLNSACSEVGLTVEELEALMA